MAGTTFNSPADEAFPDSARTEQPVSSLYGAAAVHRERHTLHVASQQLPPRPSPMSTPTSWLLSLDRSTQLADHIRASMHGLEAVLGVDAPEYKAHFAREWANASEQLWKKYQAAVETRHPRAPSSSTLGQLRGAAVDDVRARRLTEGLTLLQLATYFPNKERDMFKAALPRPLCAGNVTPQRQDLATWWPQVRRAISGLGADVQPERLQDAHMRQLAPYIVGVEVWPSYEVSRLDWDWATFVRFIDDTFALDREACVDAVFDLR